MTSGRGEEGSAVLLGGVGLVVALLVVAVALQATAVLAAAGRAQAAADAAALAAVRRTHDATPDAAQVVARRLATAAGGDLVACRCRAGMRQVRVEVAVPLRGVWLPPLRNRRVVATASARLVRGPPGTVDHPPPR